MHDSFKNMRLLLISSAAMIYSQFTVAADPITGCLLAEQACPALHSIKKHTNPGDVMLEPGVSYTVTGQNKPQPTYYQIRIDGIATPQRWVEVSCGSFSAECAASTTQPAAVPAPLSKATKNVQDYLLAISWQAGFCQEHQEKSECQSQTESRFDGTHLTLHGLWPQPQNNAYCGVSARNKTIDRRSRWDLLPEVKLSEATRIALEKVMPGTASNLERHEWTKHGTCYKASADEYFSEALNLLDQINHSPVQALFEKNIGKSLTAEQIRAYFDTNFGPGAGNKVNVKCSGKLITELWINLQGDIQPDSNLVDLLKYAPDAKLSCSEGIVDPVGF